MQSLISKMHNLWGSSSFWKCSTFYVDFRYTARNWEKIVCFLDNCSSFGSCKFFLVRREYLSLAVNVLTNTHRSPNTLKRLLPNSVFAKVMKQYDRSALVNFFRLFNMLTVERCSETTLFRDLTNHIFCSL